MVFIFFNENPAVMLMIILSNFLQDRVCRIGAGGYAKINGDLVGGVVLVECGRETFVQIGLATFARSDHRDMRDGSFVLGENGGALRVLSVVSKTIDVVSPRVNVVRYGTGTVQKEITNCTYAGYEDKPSDGSHREDLGGHVCIMARSE
jgi:hypothetical protein